MATFRKSSSGGPRDYLAWEAAGLRWLAAAHAVPVVEVLDVGPDHLDLARLEPSRATAAHAHRLGIGLARLHDSGACAHGAPPEGWEGDGYLGPADHPLPLPTGEYERWGDFYAALRVEHARRLLADRGLLGPDLATGLDRICADLRDGRWDDGAAPARLHGDLWSGNVLWTADGAVLIDAAAHGGHRLTDLAMLDLFGLPHLDAVVAGYQEAHRLPAGWQGLLELHQLYPVAIHAVLFGGGYTRQLQRLVSAYT